MQRGPCVRTPTDVKELMLTNTQPTPQELPIQALMRPHAVAKRLGVSERWVRDHATRRFPKLPVVKLGPLLRFRSADVDEFVERIRPANYTVDGGASGMREVFRIVLLPPRQWA